MTVYEVSFILSEEELVSLRQYLYGKDGEIPVTDFQKFVREKISPFISAALMFSRTGIRS